MLRIRHARERGHFDHGWLKTRHTFSFADYHDPEQMNFRDLRVINEDWIQQQSGFPTHGHRDMEIVTWVIEGALSHRDSEGNGATIRPGDVQRMTAGSGIRHSEWNDSAAESVHLLQIWLLPESQGLQPSWEQKTFAAEWLQGVLRPIVTPDGRDGALSIHQDVTVYAARLAVGDSVRHEFGATRHGWLQVARGSLEVEGLRVEQGDGLAVSHQPRLAMTAADAAELLLFDLR